MAREIRFDNGELADVEDLIHFLNVLSNVFQLGDSAPLSKLSTAKTQTLPFCFVVFTQHRSPSTTFLV